MAGASSHLSNRRTHRPPSPAAWWRMPAATRARRILGRSQSYPRAAETSSWISLPLRHLLFLVNLGGGASLASLPLASINTLPLLMPLSVSRRGHVGRLLSVNKSVTYAVHASLIVNALCLHNFNVWHICHVAFLATLAVGYT